MCRDALRVNKTRVNNDKELFKSVLNVTDIMSARAHVCVCVCKLVCKF